VSNAASTVSSEVSSTVSSAANEIVSAASNPETQAVALTVGVDALAVGAVALDVGSGGLATPLTSAAIGAAISTTMYTTTNWNHANLAGAAGAAASGAIAGAISGGIGELGVEGITGSVFSAVGSSAGNVLGSIGGAQVSALISGKSAGLSTSDLMLSALSGLTSPFFDSASDSLVTHLLPETNQGALPFFDSGESTFAEKVTALLHPGSADVDPVLVGNIHRGIFNQGINFGVSAGQRLLM
jgi:hypothetical protein